MSNHQINYAYLPNYLLLHNFICITMGQRRIMPGRGPPPSNSRHPHGRGQRVQRSTDLAGELKANPPARSRCLSVGGDISVAPGRDGAGVRLGAGKASGRNTCGSMCSSSCASPLCGRTTASPWAACSRGNGLPLLLARATVASSFRPSPASPTVPMCASASASSFRPLSGEAQPPDARCLWAMVPHPHREIGWFTTREEISNTSGKERITVAAPIVTR
jgi:hypothetical protein